MTRSPLPLRWLLLVSALTVVVPACGKRGPPLPPLRPAPDKVADLTVLRRDGQVLIRFSVPQQNADGSTPLRFDRVEVYAMTVSVGKVRPTFAQTVKSANLVATLRATPVLRPEAAPGEKPSPAGQVLVFAEAVPDVIDPPPAVPVSVSVAAPGTAAGSPSIARGLGPVPPAPASGARGDGPAPTTPAVTTGVVNTAVTTGTTRFYAIVPYAVGRRAGLVSEVAVRLAPPPAPVKDLALSYDETTLTAKWTASSGQTFHVYAADPPVIDAAPPLTVTPLTSPTWTQPVIFGKARCVGVRVVLGTTPLFFESALAGPVCDTPVDRFPPPVPAGLVAFPSEGGISLTWDAVTAADLAGYLVLRGEGADDTLRPITPEPVTATSLTDATARAGVRYIYAVVSVDRATPANRSKESNRVSEVGR